MGTLIAEDLLLVLRDPESGKLRHTSHLDVGLGGALLVDLAMAGAVEVVKGSGRWARARVRPVAAVPRPADPLLAESLDLVAAKDRAAQDLVGRLGRRRRDEVLARSESAGVVRAQRDTLLGVLPRTRWITIDEARAEEARRRVADVLLHGVHPDERTAALVALLSALDVAHRVVDRQGVSGGEVRRRAKAVAEGDWAAKAVKDAVVAAQAAVAASAALVASTAATSG